MASEYWKWKFRDVQPEEKVELTPEEKRRNWWYYHKWHVLIGILAAVLVVSLALQVIGVGQVKPDYQFAYVGAATMPDEAAEALEAGLATLGEDCNGDGKVVVTLNSYATTDATVDAENAYYNMANSTRLMADLAAADSYFFLLDDPETFQRNYGALRPLDGPADAEGVPGEECSLRWVDCPALAGLELGDYEEQLLNQTISGQVQELISGLYIARRGFYTDAVCDNVEACDALWDEITEGAVS